MGKHSITPRRRKFAVVAASLIATAVPFVASSPVRAAVSPVTVTAGKAVKLREYRSTWVPAFKLKGESIAPIVVAVTITSAPAGTSFTLNNHGKAELNYGYFSFEKVTSVVFTSDVATANEALESMNINAAGPGKVKLSVSATVDERGYAFDPVRSRYYQYVESPGITWTNALAAAATKTFRGVTGHLATPTTQAQNGFLSVNIEGAKNVWIAATDKDNEGEFKWAAGDSAGKTFWKARCAANAAGSADSCTGANNVVAGGQANGVYKDGVIADPLVNKFAAWDSSTNEPNNWGGLNPGQGGENFVATNWNGTFGLWNDLPDNTPSIGGYVVEYPNVAGKPFVGVSRATRTYTVAKETSLYRPVNVKAVQTAPGTYKVTWDAPKVLSSKNHASFARKNIVGYRVMSDANGYSWFVDEGRELAAVIYGVPNGVTPVLSVVTSTRKTPTNKDVGQRTFGAGVVASASTAKDFVKFSEWGQVPITRSSKLLVAARGLTNAASWTLTNIVDSAVLASGTFTSGATTGSVRMPDLAWAPGNRQFSVRLTITNSDGTTESYAYSLLVYGNWVEWSIVYTPQITFSECTMESNRAWTCVPYVPEQIKNWLVN